MERPLAAEGARVWPHVFPLLCFKFNVALDHRGNTESRDLRCSGLGRADILVRRQPKLIDLTHPLLWTRMSALPRVNPPPRSDPRSDLFYKWKAELKDRYERLPV